VKEGVGEAGPAETGQVTTGTGVVQPPTSGVAEKAIHAVKLVLQATREQVFKAFPAIANLTDKSDESKVTITVEGHSAQGYDPSWLRNAVEEPLDEANISPQVVKE
jgi:hypothetical protein